MLKENSGAVDECGKFPDFLAMTDQAGTSYSL
jgi:hypothetical protein